MTKLNTPTTGTLRVVVAIGGSAYAMNATRAATALVMRALLEPTIVGAINALQLFATLVVPLSLGRVYGAIRAIPSLGAELALRRATAASSASLLEGLVVSAIAAPLILPAMAGFSRFSSLVWLAIPFALVYRMYSIQESLLLTMQLHRAVVLTRAIRSMDSLIGVLAVAVTTVPASFPLISIVIGIACLGVGRGALLSVEGGIRSFVSCGMELLRRYDRYAWLVSLDRMLASTANYLDPLLIAVVSGPGTLAGYYLGINIRGLLLNVPNAMFWQRWAGAVRSYEKDGRNQFASLRFIGSVWLAAITLYVLAIGALWGVLVYLIPKYLSSFPEAAVAALLAIPASVSAVLRGRQMLERKVGRLILFSASRYAVFAAALGCTYLVQNELKPTAIAWIGYLAASLDCLANAGDNARDLRRWAIFWAIAAMLATPPIMVGLLFIVMAL